MMCHPAQSSFSRDEFHVLPVPFAGDVAIVSGAASGIGRAVALTLACRGAQVAALDCDSFGLADLLNEARDRSLSLQIFPCDVSSRARVKIAVRQITERLGPPNLLACVAGILRPGAASLLSSEDWERTFAVNTSGVMHLCCAVAPSMKLSGRGSIVTVASNAVRVARMQFAAYAASKAAASTYTKSLGLELAQYGIRCNVVSPGSTDTSMLRSDHGASCDLQRVIEGVAEQYRTGIPLQKVATPQAVAAVVAFLLSDEARHITLADICVDGGASLGA